MGVNEHYVSSARATANAGWAVSAVLLAAAWLIGLLRPDDWRIAALFAVTAIVTAIVSALMQVRIYMVKVCVLIRRTSGLATEEGGNVHAMR